MSNLYPGDQVTPLEAARLLEEQVQRLREKINKEPDMSSMIQKYSNEEVVPSRFKGMELVCRYHETTHEPVSVSAACHGFWRWLPMDEDIIIRPDDSNEECTAKTMLQIAYYLDIQPPNWLNSVKMCVDEGAITANEVLDSRR